jgi:K+-transporting ATPase KdpF subunit
MSLMTGIGLVISAFLLAYLLFALLYPEKLG